MKNDSQLLNYFSLVIAIRLKSMPFTVFDASEAPVGQACIRSDPFLNPGRRSMFQQALKARENCPPTGIEVGQPPFPIDRQNPANDPNLLGMGERANYADYAFGSALETKWCGYSGCGGPNCKACGCQNLRDPCEFAGGQWNRPAGCNRLWFTRSASSWQSPQDGNINGTIKWG